MLSVSICINGNPIMARSAVNQGEANEQGVVKYAVDDGSFVHHNPKDGAVALAIKLLKTIKEQGVEPSNKGRKRRRWKNTEPNAELSAALSAILGEAKERAS